MLRPYEFGEKFEEAFLRMLSKPCFHFFSHFAYECLDLKVLSATFGPINMFKKQWLSFHVVSKTFITQNYLCVIPSNILRFSCLYRSFLAHFKPRDNRGKHDFEKQCYCGNYSHNVYQCLNTDQVLLKIQYFDHNTL